MKAINIVKLSVLSICKTLSLSAFLITKCFCLRKLCRALNSFPQKLIFILFPLKQSKEEDVMSKIFNLTGLV